MNQIIYFSRHGLNLLHRLTSASLPRAGMDSHTSTCTPGLNNVVNTSVGVSGDRHGLSSVSPLSGSLYVHVDCMVGRDLHL